MNRGYLLRRLGWTAVAAYILLSAMFFAVALTPDPNETMAEFAAAVAALDDPSIENKSAYIKQAGAAYLEVRNKDKPLWVRYRRWMVGYATLKLGYSFAYEQPVRTVLANTIPVTVVYAGAGILVSWLVSLCGGVYAALHRGGVIDRLGGVISSVGLGVPAAVIVGVLAGYSRDRVAEISYPTYDQALGLFTPHNMAALAIPTAIIAFSVTVVQWPAVRSELADLQGEQFVRTLRAGGAGWGRLARHLLKNATAPFLELLKSQVLVVLLLTVYVIEEFLGIPGVGTATLLAFEERDVGLILATVMLPAFVGLLGNLIADLVAGRVDPRVSS